MEQEVVEQEVVEQEAVGQEAVEQEAVEQEVVEQDSWLPNFSCATHVLYETAGTVGSQKFTSKGRVS